MLVDLANKLGAPLAKDVDSLRKSLSSAVGKGGYSPAASSGTSSWRTASPAPAASNGSTDRWSSYSRSAPAASNGASAGGNVSTSELNAFKVGHDCVDGLKPWRAEARMLACSGQEWFALR
jgi:hypothetical protein